MCDGILDKTDHVLTHWGRVTHICLNKLTIIGSNNGLSPGRRQAIIWTNVGILLIRPLGTNFNEIVIEIYTFSLKKTYLEMSSAKCWPSCLGLNVLTRLNSRCSKSLRLWVDQYVQIDGLVPIDIKCKVQLGFGIDKILRFKKKKKMVLIL